jgi:adenylate cyclase class IV
MDESLVKMLTKHRASLLRDVRKTRSWYVKTGMVSSLERITTLYGHLAEVETQLAKAQRLAEWE